MRCHDIGTWSRQKGQWNRISAILSHSMFFWGKMTRPLTLCCCTSWWENSLVGQIVTWVVMHSWHQAVKNAGVHLILWSSAPSRQQRLKVGGSECWTQDLIFQNSGPASSIFRAGKAVLDCDWRSCFQSTRGRRCECSKVLSLHKSVFHLSGACVIYGVANPTPPEILGKPAVSRAAEHFFFLFFF